nr:N-acetylglucosamine-6-phosphate deacetylase [uncultured Caproiciproducens sp.]
MLLKNAMLFMPDCIFHRGTLRTYGERITEADRETKPLVEEESLDADGMYAVPGLIDIHLHGAINRDFCEGTADAIRAIADFELHEGVTAFLCATMAQPEITLLQICDAAGQYKFHEGAEFLGINMEAPFISVEKCGAQDKAFIHKPDIELFNRLQEAAHGRIKIVGIAPECDGSEAFLEQLKGRIIISLAHTAADYSTAKRAFLLGATHVTHLLNAMPPFLHRNPGVVGAAWEESNCIAEMICDGNFVVPTMMRAMLKLFGAERIAMISDGMPATGMPEGTYSLGGDAVVVKDGVGSMVKGGALAGPTISLMGVMRTAVSKCGFPLEAAVQCATLTPARSLGIDDLYGSLAPGHYADIVLLDAKLNVRVVIFRGKIVCDYRKSDFPTA